ncbi:MAG: cytochrome ubiquinol oxidase subunit I [Pseudomonadota bacterium]
MGILELSRAQFAATTLFHFLFVPLTLGLSVLVAIAETYWVKTHDEIYLRMAKFWGKLFLINFALGVVTGITLEFQFGTNWARYSAYVGDIFGSLLAVEATVAFFLESTFLGVWIFGWKKISPKLHCAAIWIVAIASNLSAFWILAANAWMQHPVGYEIRNGRAELVNFLDVITQRWAFLEFFHTIGGAYTLAGFFMVGISAWHLLRKQHVEFFSRSFRLGILFSFLASFFVAFQGHMSAENLAKLQPAKLAAAESQWETGKSVPLYLLRWPDTKNERNAIEAFPIPGMLSILANYDPSSEVKGLKTWPKEDRPPVLVSFLSFRMMVGLGTLFLVLTLYGFLRRNRILADLDGNRRFLRIMVFAIPLPYLAIELGWVLTEVGRQPWIVYGLMKTKDAVSTNISASQVAVSLGAFVVVYALLGIIDFYLLAKYARKGPASE